MHALISWLIAVAMAAPAVPSEKACMNSGSSPILSMPPMLMPIMANFILPSALKRLFMTNDITINGAASSI